MYGVVILNKLYELTRLDAEEGPGVYKDIEEVGGDKERVMLLFTEVLKIPVENIVVLEDGNYEEVDALWDEIKLKYTAAGRKLNPKGETLFVIWYGGHGEMGGSAFTQISLNVQPDDTNRFFPLEASIL